MSQRDRLDEDKVGGLIVEHFEDAKADPQFCNSLMDRYLSANRGPNRSPLARLRPVAIAASVIVLVLALLAIPLRNRLGVFGARAADFTIASMHQPVMCSFSQSPRVGDRVAGTFTVRTGKGGRLGLITDRGSYIYLDSNTELSAAGRSHVTVSKGRMYCSNRGEVKSIGTPAGQVVLLGTVLTAEVRGKDKAAVTVIRGKVRLVNSRGSAVVSAGRKSVLVAQANPTDGEPVNTVAETAWYDGRGQMLSDSGQLTYRFRRGNGQTTEIWAMNADGTGKRRLVTYPGPGYVYEPVWIPGRNTVLFQASEPGATGLRTVNLTTGQELRLDLHEPFEWIPQPTVSPGGRYIGFYGLIRRGECNDDSECGIYIYDMMTGQLRKVTDGHSLDGGVPEPMWSPDGRTLAISFCFALRGYGELVLIDTTTWESRRLGIRGHRPVFSPDGERLAYNVWPISKVSGVEWQGDGQGIHVLDLRDGSNKVTVAAQGEPGVLPEFWWSPDGRWILYVKRLQDSEGKPLHNTKGDDRYTLNIASADGKETRMIGGIESLCSPKYCWSSTGDAVYVTTRNLISAFKWGINCDPTLGHVLKVPIDGSGRIVDLGGNVKDSPLTPDEAAQTQAALKEIDTAAKIGDHWDAYDSDEQFDRVRRKARAAADILASLPSKYPLAGLSVAPLLHQVQELDSVSTRTDAQFLAEICRARTRTLRVFFDAYTACYGKLPANIDVLKENIVSVLKKSGDWERHVDQRKEEEACYCAFACPGKDRVSHTSYTYTAQGKTHLNADDLLFTCPNHPQNGRIAGKQIAGILNRR